MELKYFAKHSFAIILPKYQGGKESIYNALVDLLKKQEQKGCKRPIFTSCIASI